MSHRSHTAPDPAKAAAGSNAAKEAPRILYIVEAGLLGLTVVGYIAMQVLQHAG
jgi:hypothetical protein